MASWTDLSTSTLYTTLLTQINDRGVDAAYAFDPASTTVTNPKTGHVRFNSANKRWEKYNGSSWIELIAASTDSYAMTVTGLRGGSMYGTINASAAIVNGGTFDATILRRAGSDAWTAATLTNLSQLTNGPGYLVASALTPYALLASPDFTGTPKIAGNPIATQSYVAGLNYLNVSTAAATYAPLGGAGTSGTWAISVSGNSATTSQRTFSNVRTDGINRGTYGTVSIAGLGGAYAGIDFTAASLTLMVQAGGPTGFFKESTGTWIWYFDGSGVLTAGTVPWARVTGGTAPGVGTFPNDAGYAALAGANFSGQVRALGIGTLVGSNGQIGMQTGDASHTGYVELSNAAGTRQHYIGYVTTGGPLNFHADNAAGWNFDGGGNLSCAGLLVGRGGGSGLGRIVTTATPGAPVGTSPGDLTLVY